MKKLFLLLLAVIPTAFTVRAQSAPTIIYLPLGEGCIKNPNSIVVNEKEDMVFTASTVSDEAGVMFPHDGLIQRYDNIGNFVSEHRYNEIAYSVKPNDLVLYNDNVIMTATLFQAFSNDDGFTVMVLDTNLNPVDPANYAYPFLPPSGKRIEVSSKSFVSGNTISFVATMTSTAMNTNGTEFLDPKVLLFQLNLVTKQFNQIELEDGKVCAAAVVDGDVLYVVLRNSDLTGASVQKFSFQDGIPIWASADVPNIPDGNIRGFGFGPDGMLYLASSNELFQINPSYGAVEPIGSNAFIVSQIENGFLLGSSFQSNTSHNAGDKVVCSAITALDSLFTAANFTDSNPLTMTTVADMHVGQDHIFFTGRISNFGTNPITQTGFMGWFDQDHIYFPDNLTTGISENHNTDVMVTPNPTNDGNVTLRTKNKGSFFTVTNVLGEVILTQQITDKEINLHFNSGGIYFLKTEGGEVTIIAN